MRTNKENKSIMAYKIWWCKKIMGCNIKNSLMNNSELKIDDKNQ